MSQSNDQQRKEIEALWAQVFGDEPDASADTSLLAGVLIQHLPPAPPYGDPVAWRDRESLPAPRRRN
jgi:hypothetical protein